MKEIQVPNTVKCYKDIEKTICNRGIKDEFTAIIGEC